MGQPKVIFLDAVGTLFGVDGTVGEIYNQIAHRFGIETDPVSLNRAFFDSFKAAPPMAFPDAIPTDVPAQEYAWWRDIAQASFARVDALDKFEDFEAFFADLYAHFTTAEPWTVYPDTFQSLEYLKSLGIELGILSNFDSRLYAVLEVLNLADFFQSVTISTEVGAAKPDPMIFAAALQKHQCVAEDAWHIGDSYTMDFQGAKAAGIKSIWLKRTEP